MFEPPTYVVCDVGTPNLYSQELAWYISWSTWRVTYTVQQGAPSWPISGVAYKVVQWGVPFKAAFNEAELFIWLVKSHYTVIAPPLSGFQGQFCLISPNQYPTSTHS